MSFEWLETDFGIKSYCHSTVFVFLTGNCVPNQLFTGTQQNKVLCMFNRNVLGPDFFAGLSFLTVFLV
jgi:hypothetical protein